MRKTYPGAFVNQSSLVDQANTQFLAAPNGARTAGAQTIQTAALGGPTQNQHWTIQAVSITGLLAFSASNGLIASGKFGRIRAGLIIDDNSNFTTSPSGVVSNLTQLPANDVLLGDLWNSANDDMPPEFPFAVGLGNSLNVNNALAVSFDLIPSIPLTLTPEQQPAIGVWMLPSTYTWAGGGPGFIALALQNLQYVINYDDGL